MGLRSEEGRAEELTYSVGAFPKETLKKKEDLERKLGRKVSWDEFKETHPEAITINQTSIFDPALCETLYRWFCPEGGTILDPFAGGSVRGIVAGKLGFSYVGNDLRPEQIEANRKQAAELMAEGEPMPVWSCGDSQDIDELAKGVQADFVFSCPPYADLEVYSDDARDISNMDYPEFLKAYRNIIAKTCAMLKEDAFACFVVSEVRSKRGEYYGFVADTVKAFEDAGLRYYNECILATSLGSAVVRCGNAMTATRKLTRVHQNILVFVKGDERKAAKKIGTYEMPEDFEEAAAEQE